METILLITTLSTLYEYAACLQFNWDSYCYTDQKNNLGISISFIIQKENHIEESDIKSAQIFVVVPYIRQKTCVTFKPPKIRFV